MQTLLSDLPLDCRRELVELLEETTPVGTWDWNIEANTFHWSPRQFAHFGLATPPGGAITYDVWLQAIHPEDRELVHAAIGEALAGPASLDITFRVLWREDDATSAVDVHWLRSRGRVVCGEDGSPLRMVGTSRDVTELEQTRVLLRVQRDANLADLFGGPSRFDVFFQSSQDCLVQLKVEDDGRYTYQLINPAGLDAIGMTLAAAHGLTPVDVMGEANGSQMVEMLDAVRRTRLPVRYEPTFDYGSRRVDYEATYMPLHDEHGAVSAILCRARDVTDERRMAAALEQAQKMEALGQMAAGVAHDFNNVLTSLAACFHRLQRLSASVEVKHVVELGSGALRQGESLTRRLLTFARKQDLLVEDVSLAQCVERALPMIRAAAPTAAVRANIADADCRVLADAGLLEACLLNLCINARDARPDCTISIELGMENAIEPSATDLHAGDYAVLRVRDDGPGMSAEVLSRVLEPFFTTKERGKGTGLGLSMVYGTVKTLGGTVTVDSELGQGTEVTVMLPIARHTIRLPSSTHS